MTTTPMSLSCTTKNVHCILKVQLGLIEVDWSLMFSWVSGGDKLFILLHHRHKSCLEFRCPKKATVPCRGWRHVHVFFFTSLTFIFKSNSSVQFWIWLRSLLSKCCWSWEHDIKGFINVSALTANDNVFISLHSDALLCVLITFLYVI